LGGRSPTLILPGASNCILHSTDHLISRKRIRAERRSLGGFITRAARRRKIQQANLYFSPPRIPREALVEQGYGGRSSVETSIDKRAIKLDLRTVWKAEFKEEEKGWRGVNDGLGLKRQEKRSGEKEKKHTTGQTSILAKTLSLSGELPFEGEGTVQHSGQGQRKSSEKRLKGTLETGGERTPGKREMFVQSW